MQHTKLGRTGLRVSRLCLGTMTFGGQCDEARSHAILDAAAEGGIDFLDTADVYPLGGGRATAGRTEEIVGAWLKGKRHQFIVATKCAGQVGTQAMGSGHVAQAHPRCDRWSLRRLGTDYVDLYQLHRYDPNTPMDEALEALDTVVRAGQGALRRCLQLASVQDRPRAWAAARSSIWPASTPFSRATTCCSARSSAICCRCARKKAIAVIPYNPIAGGLLSGKHDVNRASARGHAVFARNARRQISGALLA